MGTFSLVPADEEKSTFSLEPVGEHTAFEEPTANSPMKIYIGAKPSGSVGTGIKALAQGMTGNTADEIDAYLTSKGLNPFSDKIPYEEKLAWNRQNDKADAAANPVSDFVGGAAGTILDAAGLGGAFPTAAKALASVASKGVLPSLATSSGVGALSGMLYGAGAGEGEASARLENAGDNGLLGGLFGLAGAAVARPVASLTQRALNLVAKKVPQVAQKVEGAITRSPNPQSQAVDGVIPLTQGQATQNPSLQALENKARAGAIDDASQASILQADAKQQDAIKNVVQGVTRGGGEDALTKAGAVLKNSYKNIKGQVSKAYDNSDAVRGVFVDKKPLAESFAPRVNDIAYKSGFDMSDMSPQTQKLVGQLDTLNDPKVTAVNLEKMKFWRTKVGNQIEASKDSFGKMSPEGAMLSKVAKEYDTFMAKLPEGALKSGDSEALKNLQNANYLRRKQGVLFERDKVVSNIVKNDDLTNEELANLVLTGSQRGQGINAASGRYVKAMKKAAGDNADQITDGLRKGVLARAMGRSTVATQQTGSEAQMISPAKLSKELDGILSNKSFTNQVFDSSHINTLTRLRDDLRKVASDQPGSRNYSNTAYTIIHALRRLPLGLSSLAAVGEIGLKPIAEKGARDELNKSLQGVLGNAQGELVGKAKLYGAAVGGSQQKGKEE